MKTKSKWATKGAAAGALVLLLATPSFAQSRGQSSRNDSNRRTEAGSRDDRSSNRESSSYRENQRVTLSGRVSSFAHERDGYRVQLDRGGQSFWAPQSAFGRRSGDLRAGVSISVGGVFRGGSIYVDAVSWPDNYGSGYSDGFLRGVVERIDVRSGTLWLRDEANGRLIAADMHGGDRYSRVNLQGLRRGDFVELTGQWVRGGVFDVARIDNVRNVRNGRF